MTMDTLRRYLNSLPKPEQLAFAERCGTSLGYLRKVVYSNALFGAAITIAIERESGAAVRCEELLPDVDWGYIRGTAAQKRDRAAA